MTCVSCNQFIDPATAHIHRCVKVQAINSIAEVVRGLSRDRTYLLEDFNKMNRSWAGFPDWEKVQNEKIAYIDRRIDQLLASERKEGKK